MGSQSWLKRLCSSINIVLVSSSSNSSSRTRTRSRSSVSLSDGSCGCPVGFSARLPGLTPEKEKQSGTHAQSQKRLAGGLEWGWVWLSGSVGGRMEGGGTSETSRKQAEDEWHANREMKAEGTSDSQATLHRVQAMAEQHPTRSATQRVAAKLNVCHG